MYLFRLKDFFFSGFSGGTALLTEQSCLMSACEKLLKMKTGAAFSFMMSTCCLRTTTTPTPVTNNFPHTCLWPWTSSDTGKREPWINTRVEFIWNILPWLSGMWLFQAAIPSVFRWRVCSNTRSVYEDKWFPQPILGLGGRRWWHRCQVKQMIEANRACCHERCGWEIRLKNTFTNISTSLTFSFCFALFIVFFFTVSLLPFYLCALSSFTFISFHCCRFSLYVTWNELSEYVCMGYIC